MPHRKNNSNLMSTSSKIFKKISDYFKKELWSVFFVINIDEISKNQSYWYEYCNNIFKFEVKPYKIY
jgi:hypothetical protein